MPASFYKPQAASPAVTQGDFTSKQLDACACQLVSQSLLLVKYAQHSSCDDAA